MRIDEGVLQNLVGSIYDHIDQPGAIAELLSQTTVLFSAANTNLGIVQDGVVEYHSQYVPEDMLEKRYLPIIDTDPWYVLPRQIEGPKALLATQYISTKDYKKYPHYDINRELDFEYLAGFANTGHRKDLEFFMVCTRSRTQGDFDTTVLKYFELLGSHLGRALRLKKNTSKTDNTFACVVLEDRRIVEINEQLLGLVYKGVFRTRLDNDRFEFCEEQIQSRFETFEAQSSASSALVVLQPGLYALWEKFSYLDSQYSRKIRTRVRFVEADEFNFDFGYTEAEKEIVLLLLKGLSIQEIAVVRHRSVHTIRTQVKSILNKTNVSSQRELVVRLASETC
ncbi:MAG: LuxR C-terminal-related transcriptional regulator [Pseudomonadota bacterium]